MRALLGHLLTAPLDDATGLDLDAWWKQHRVRAAVFARPIDRAIAGGLGADRLGHAFAAGYHAALSALLPEVGGDLRAALCATERGGAHPRAIETTLTARADGRFLVRGHKRWATLSTRADLLLVVVKAGEDTSGRRDLRLVRIDPHRTGVVLRPMPETPFAPEIPHAELDLDDVVIEPSDVLAGDGYERYLKPFRTIEDAHVLGAALGYLAGVGRRFDWPKALREETLALVVTVRTLALEPPDAPEIHLALAGLITGIASHIEQSRESWALVDAEERARFERDRALLAIASNARAARAARAWSRFGAGEGG